MGNNKNIKKATQKISGRGSIRRDDERNEHDEIANIDKSNGACSSSEPEDDEQNEDTGEILQSVRVKQCTTVEYEYRELSPGGRRLVNKSNNPTKFRPASSVSPKVSPIRDLHPQHKVSGQSHRFVDDNIKKTDSYERLSWLILISGFVATVGILYYCYSYSTTEHNNIKEQEPMRKKCSFTNLKQKFLKEEDNLWKSLNYGVEGILNDDPAVPRVFLFLHENTLNTTNLILQIAQNSAACFDPHLKPFVLNRSDFNSDDYGTAIQKYKENIKDSGVLIVANLNEIPGEAARALHSICDKYSPIYRKVIIFLTLLIDPSAKGYPLVIAESTLQNLWENSIKSNELEPLIVRVTDSVFRLRS